MRFALGPRAKKAGYRLLAFETLDSTNSEALRRAREGDCGALWVVSEAQTQGRGRRGRQWLMPAGNLAATVLIKTNTPLSEAATLGFVAGLALNSALLAHTSGVDFRFKWPNDILSGGAKLAGILLESESVGGGLVVAVGVGVNIASAPAGLPQPVTSLSGLGQSVDAGSIFAVLTDAWTEMLMEWGNGRGMDSIRTQWLNHAEGRGKTISIRTGEGFVSGVFEAIDISGALILRMTDGNVMRVCAGDVYFDNPVAAEAR